MDRTKVEEALRRDREVTVAQREQLQRDLDEMFAAAVGIATDDEHDPEGATVAYERAQTESLLEQADVHLADIAVAFERIDAGSYGTCVECGGEIGSERLEARPVVRTCIRCAAT